jgi:hypothetical protein
MAICWLMISDFMHQTGRYDGRAKLYDDRNLKEGIDYCEWLIEDGYRREPFWRFDLSKFIRWARRKLK